MVKLGISFEQALAIYADDSADLIIDDDEVELVEVQACRETLSKAKNLAASKIMEIVKTKKPILFEAPQVIAIYDSKEKHSTKLVNKFFKLCRDYRRIAAQGELQLHNRPTNSHLKPYPKRDIINELTNNPRRTGFKPELTIDSDMMAIFAIMVSYGKSDFEKPGCLPYAFFVDLMGTITIECSKLSFSPVNSLFCTKYKAKDGSSHNTSVIRIDPEYNDSIKSIQDLIDKNIFIKDFETFEQLPEMLTFSVAGPFFHDETYRFDYYNPSIEDNLEINENLKIGATDYNFLGQVFPISGFQDRYTGEKKCRGLPPTLTDRFIGLHSVLLIRHKGELIEVNNHEVL
uniref:Uncharacterized protein n=1 Tax=Tetranychus urticae TaxID=32264 RepID=T1JVX7_TETUR